MTSRRATWPIPRARRSLSRRPRVECLESRELLAGFTVTSNADSGPNTLRAAIQAANADTSLGGYSISFQIANSGVQTISLLSPLPAIARTVAMDATTEPGYSGTPLVVIDGTNAGAGTNGLPVGAGSGSVIRGLSIVGFTGGASAILLGGGSSGTTVEANYLGLLPDGQTAKPNSNGLAITTANNVIGVPGQANVISGNANAGVLIVGATANHNLLANNLIGTDKSGFFAVGNHYGVILAGPNNTVGGLTSASRNVISGNLGPTGQDGIGILFSGASTGNLVQGNLVGTDISGGTGSNTTAAVPNVYGIYFGSPGGNPADAVSQDTIGGTVGGAGNIISGNVVGITGNRLTGGLIAGNTIGLAGAASSRAVPNGAGILLGASTTTIGGTVAAARNVISASSGTNNASGIGLELSGDADLIQGNYIGAYLNLSSDLPANAALRNLTGVSIHLSNSTIGGTAQGASNVISGNAGDGLVLDNNPGNLIQGNAIGLNPGLNGALLNGGAGIALKLTAPTVAPTQPLALNDTIGGLAPGAGNTIAFNGGPNIVVRGSYPTGYTGFAIRGNKIFGNQQVGIDLAGTGVPAPPSLFLTEAPAGSSQNSLSGVFQGLPSTAYSLDFFGNNADSPILASNQGPGQDYLTSQSVTTDSTGLAAFTVQRPNFAYAAYSATMTGPDGNTSEFSTNFPALPTAPQADVVTTLTASTGTVTVGTALSLIAKVTNNGPNPVANVKLFDTLALSFVNASVVTSLGTASVDANNVVSALIGTLASGQSATVTITGTPNQVGALVNNAGSFGSVLDPDYNNNESTQTLTVAANTTPTADLAITKVASTPTGRVGTNLTYTVRVTNNGPSAATNVTVNDILPSSVVLISANSSQGAVPSANGTLITDNLGTLASGASATLTIVVRPSSAGTIVNNANVSGNQTDPVLPNNSTSLSTVIAPINGSLVLSAAISNPTGVVGQIQFFTLTVTNPGTDPITNATIVNTLPANATFVLAAPSQGPTPTPVNGVITDNLGTIPGGGRATLTIVVVPTKAGTVINYAGVYSPDFPSVPASFAFGAILAQAPIVGPSVTALAGSGRNSQLAISFSLALDPTTATNRANYTLVATGSNRKIAIVAATYSQVDHSVRIVPAAPLNANLTYRLTVIGSTSSGIKDSLGRRLVGTPGGASGTNYTVDFLAGSLPQV